MAPRVSRLKPRVVLFSLIIAAAVSIDHRHLVGPFAQDADLDCAMRNLTWGYALALLPARAPLQSVFDALRLELDCNMTRPIEQRTPPPFYKAPGGGILKTLPLPLSTSVWYVDAAHGSDANPCTLAAPCETISCALNHSRTVGGGGTIVLRDSGPLVLDTPLVLEAGDSGLTIAAYPQEAPQILGGALLSSLSWELVGPSPNASSNSTVWVASLANQSLARVPFDALFLGGRRAIRARYPNANPESDLVPDGYTRAASWNAAFSSNTPLDQINPLLGTLTRAACPSNACTEGGSVWGKRTRQVVLTTPSPTHMPGGPSGYGPPWAIFCCFFWGINASVENFTTGGFWGVHPGPPGGPTYHTPGGFVAGPDLIGRLATWATPTDAIVHAFHESYWGDWAFTVASVNATSGEVAFAAGGWQEARGAGAGDYLYVENVREELDAPGEWFVDHGGMLFYCANGTEPPPAAGWVAGQLENLISLEGTAELPVTDVALAGITFAYTEPTFLRPFTAPSGGDWTFHDGGAVRFSGTSNCSVSGSLFVNVGGNGVMLSGWNRGAIVMDSEFLWIGEHAIVSSGLSGGEFNNTAPGAPYGAAPLISGILAHELGVFVKQTGFYYQAMTANASVIGNVFFNGPRAGINVNDGFAGGHEISRNVAFNMVRETSDHGPINTWDRNTCEYRYAGVCAAVDGRVEHPLFSPSEQTCGLLTRLTRCPSASTAIS